RCCRWPRSQQTGDLRRRSRDGRRLLHLRVLRAAAAEGDGRDPRSRRPARRRARPARAHSDAAACLRPPRLGAAALARPAASGRPLWTRLMKERDLTAHGGSALMRRAWPLERVLFALAGTMTLLAAFLAATVSLWFLLLAAFVGLNQWLYVVVGACPASLVLARVTGREAAWCRR